LNGRVGNLGIRIEDGKPVGTACMLSVHHIGIEIGTDGGGGYVDGLSSFKSGNKFGGSLDLPLSNHSSTARRTVGATHINAALG